MSQESKNRTTTILLIIAIMQGPILYYFTFGFFRLLGIAFFGLVGFILTFFLFLDILRHRETNTKYHMAGLLSAFIIGIWTIFGNGPEYLDWKLRKWERNKIVQDIKSDVLRPDSSHRTGSRHLSSFLPLSNDDNNIDIEEHSNGIVSVTFYIDRGFLDHFSAFVYTNDPGEINEFDKGIGPFGGGTVKKLDQNWYRVAY